MALRWNFRLPWGSGCSILCPSAEREGAIVWPRTGKEYTCQGVCRVGTGAFRGDFGGGTGIAIGLVENVGAVGEFARGGRDGEGGAAIAGTDSTRVAAAGAGSAACFCGGGPGGGGA